METLADYPDLCAQMRPDNDFGIQPAAISYGSKLKLYWRCDLADDQTWYAAVNERAEAGDG